MKKSSEKHRDPVSWCSNLQERGWVNNRQTDELLALLAVSGSEIGMSIRSKGNILHSISSKIVFVSHREYCFGDEKNPAGMFLFLERIAVNSLWWAESWLNR